jgi:hypothetical protein
VIVTDIAVPDEDGFSFMMCFSGMNVPSSSSAREVVSTADGLRARAARIFERRLAISFRRFGLAGVLRSYLIDLVLQCSRHVLNQPEDAMAKQLTMRSVGFVVVLALVSIACRSDHKPGSPEAISEGARLMRQMSDLLSKAKALRFDTTEIHDQVPFLASTGPVSLSRKAIIRRPDRLFFEFHANGPTPIGSAVYYDGRTLSLRSDVHRVWAQTAVPPTLDQMFDDVSIRLGIPVPIADLLYSNPYEALITSGTRGGFVGREQIGDRTCKHLAYVAEAVDFEIWIDAVGPPLPCRLEITYKRSPDSPKSRMDFTNWSLDTVEGDSTFTFHAPDTGYTRIRFVEFVEPARADGESGDSAVAR